MPLEDIIFHHGLQYMMYADDIQLYITCDGDQVSTGTIEEYVGDIHNWMLTNMLVFNERKTEVIHFSTIFNDQGPVPQWQCFSTFSSKSPLFCVKYCFIPLVLSLVKVKLRRIYICNI